VRKLSAAFFAVLLHEHGTPDNASLIDSYLTHLFELAEGIFGFAVGEHLMPKLRPELANQVRSAALKGAVLIEVQPAERKLRGISLQELERMLDFREFKHLPDPRESIVFFTTKAGIAAVRETELQKNRVAVNFVDLAYKKRSKKEKPTNQVDLFKILSRKRATADLPPARDFGARSSSGAQPQTQSHNSPADTFIDAKPADDSTGFQQSRGSLVASRSIDRVVCLRKSWLSEIKDKKRSGQSLLVECLRRRRQPGQSPGEEPAEQAEAIDGFLLPDNLHSGRSCSRSLVRL
jgi:hypothetical protein